MAQLMFTALKIAKLCKVKITPHFVHKIIKYLCHNWISFTT